LRFGLVHGLGLPSPDGPRAAQPALAVSLVSFNLGVEAGQLAIVATFLPIAYSVAPVVALSAVRAWGGLTEYRSVASVWLIERS